MSGFLLLKFRAYFVELFLQVGATLVKLNSVPERFDLRLDLFSRSTLKRNSRYHDRRLPDGASRSLKGMCALESRRSTDVLVSLCVPVFLHCALGVCCALINLTCDCLLYDRPRGSMFKESQINPNTSIYSSFPQGK
ncbi:hypothetical protein B0H14DRAFT_2576183 [Mycena olivaceomarginata]|nr:hypothetical protein B0H14DRAFT_2576183 [Mycena olivaceomarginata]